MRELVMLWFVLAIAAACLFYVLFLVAAMPVFRRHGIIPEMMRKGGCFVNTDVDQLAELLISEGRSLTPYYALIVVRWVFCGSILLIALSAMRSCA